MRDRLAAAGRRGKRGAVDFVTNPKVIQAFLTGGAFAILGTGAGVVAAYVGPAVPVRPVAVKWVLIVGVTAFWYWADRHQQRFEALVEDATGEGDDD